MTPTAIPNQLFLVVVSAVVIGAVLAWTPFGRSLYAIGNNETGARFSGLPVQRNKLIIYTLSGFMSGLAGWVFVSRVSTTRSDMGTGFELDRDHRGRRRRHEHLRRQRHDHRHGARPGAHPAAQERPGAGGRQGRLDHDRGRCRPHPGRADQHAHPQPAGAAEAGCSTVGAKDYSPREEVTRARIRRRSQRPTSQDTVRRWTRRGEETKNMRKPIVLLTALPCWRPVRGDSLGPGPRGPLGRG